MFGSSRSRSGTERTAQERERAREERERLRAQRSGEVSEPVEETVAPDPPVPPVVEEAPPSLEPAAAEEELELEEEVPLPFESAAAEQEPLVEQEPILEQEPSVSEEADVAEEPAELLVEDAAIDLDPVEIPLPMKLPPPAPPPERLPPLPSGTGRRGRRSDPVLERRAHRLRAHRSSGRETGGRITRARVGAFAALVAVIVVVWFVLSLFQPFAGSGHGSVIVDIPKGSSSGAIGTVLAHDGVVSSGFFFQARALVEGKRGDLHSGRFRMRHDMSYSAAIAVLSKPPPKVIAVRVVIPEGETRPQIAQLAHANGLTGSYLVASVRSSRLKPAHYGAPASTPNLEGFLFPATYETHAGAPSSLLVAEQLAAFRAHFGNTEIHAARALNVTPYGLLTIASMIEREAQVSRDRPLIAAVIYNRLRLGMTLGIDATIRYALHDFSAPLTEAQLQLNSPYNTRLHKGLPPTPISNPGAASIDAAAHPAHVGYLYYVAAADGCGAQVFSSSYAQFQQNAAAYQQAIAKNHGRVPTCKKK